MKLKYKKIILLTTMSTMGIGLLTLSISRDNITAQEKNTSSVMEASVLTDETYSEDEAAKLAAEDMVESFSVTNTESTPTPDPTPTPVPVYELEEDAYPQLNELLEKHLDAKARADRETLKTLWSNPANVKSQEDLQKDTDYIEEYRNIKVYSKKGIVEGTYILYVYNEIKFIGINTTAPGLNKYYVITTPDQELKLYNDDFDDELKEYIDDRNQDADVTQLINMTDEKGKEARSKDEDLKTFWEYMIEKVEEGQSSSQAEGDGE